MSIDTAAYAFVPEIIGYYLHRDPNIPNVQSYRCMNKREPNFVLAKVGFRPHQQAA